MVIILMAIVGYFIIDHWWLSYCWVLVTILLETILDILGYIIIYYW
jgi:hypothetical protein